MFIFEPSTSFDYIPFLALWLKLHFWLCLPPKHDILCYFWHSKPNNVSMLVPHMCLCIARILTPASLRGVIMTPPGKNLANISFVICFAHRFLRKKMNGRRKFCHRKKIEKRYMGGSSESPDLAKI